MSEGISASDHSDTSAFEVSLFTSAAHEMKQPLALVRQLALAIESEQLTPQEIALYARRIHLTSDKSLRLVTNLTKAHRLDDSLFTLEPINPISLCREVADEFKAVYAEHGRKIQVDARQRAPLVVANRDLLYRVLCNFADNALHYAESDEPVRLRASATQSGQRVRIAVRDHGPGISGDVWQKLADNQHHGVARRPASSSLGLVVSRQFAEAMHGTLGVTNHRDGASFYVDLMGSTQLQLL